MWIELRVIMWRVLSMSNHFHSSTPLHPHMLLAHKFDRNVCIVCFLKAKIIKASKSMNLEYSKSKFNMVLKRIESWTLIKVPHSPLTVTERISATHSPATLQTPTMSPDKHDSPHSKPWHPCIAHGFSIGLTQTPSPSQTPAPGGPHDSPQFRPIHSSDPVELMTKERKLLIRNNEACKSYTPFSSEWILEGIHT